MKKMKNASIKGAVWIYGTSDKAGYIACCADCDARCVSKGDSADGRTLTDSLFVAADRLRLHHDYMHDDEVKASDRIQVHYDVTDGPRVAITKLAQPRYFGDLQWAVELDDLDGTYSGSPARSSELQKGKA